MGNKDSQTAKARNSLIYDQNHIFYKYRLTKFSNISSVESKFDMLEMFYGEFICLKSLEDRTKENTNHKFVVLNNALNEYGKLIKEYKKVYEREPMAGSKSITLKTLNHQPVKLETKSLPDENNTDLKQPT